MPRTYTVIDADAHVNPLVTFWADYLPARFKDRAPRLEGGADLDYVVFEGQKTPFTQINAQAGVRPQDHKATGKLQETRPGGWDPAARLSDMDIDGIDGAIIFGGGPLGSSDPELFLASFHAYNQWLVDFCAEAPDRLLGVAYIPMFDVPRAVEELRWAAARGLKGAVIPAFPPPPTFTGGALNLSNLIMYADPDGPKSYSDPEFDPFWQTAVDLGMPVHVHLGGVRSGAATGVDGRFRGQMRSKLVMAEVITYFIMRGILPKHPDLRLVSVESGVGWFAFAAEYLDNTWRKHRFSTKTPIAIEPSTYWDRQVHGTFLEDAAGVNNRNLKGGRNIMWSSDYPHSETTWPNSRQAIERSLKEVPPSERDLLIAGNARKLYHLD